MDDQKRSVCTQEVVEDIHRNESLTGFTSISDAHGLSHQELREIGESIGYRVEDIGIRGGFSARFQRLLPGENYDPGVVDADADPKQSLLAALDNAQTAVNGKVSIDVTALPSMAYSDLQELIGAHGWEALDFDTRSQGTPQRRRFFARSGTTPVDDMGNEFIHGPPLGELRKHEAAVRTARWCQREFGIDPLSEEELDKARVTHKRLNKQAIKYGCLFTIPFLIFVVFLLAAVGSGESVGLVLAAVVAVPTVIGLVLVIRSTKRLKRETKRYRDAYTRVAAAAFGKTVPS